MRIRSIMACLLLGSVLSGCASERTPERRTEPSELGAETPDPLALFFGLEERMVLADTVDVDFAITAEGAIIVDLQGLLRISPDSTVLSAFGTFAGEGVEVTLHAGSGEMRFGSGDQQRTAAVPEFLQEALGIGMTRMGVLHNLAMLAAGAPPDRGDGGVREWVTVDGFSLGREGVLAEDRHSLSFQITVDGTPAGSAVLDLDENGIPVERRQVVSFPEGEMRVIERYSRVVIHP